MNRVALLTLLLPVLATAQAPPAAVAVRAETLRANADPAGHPLPVVAHWHEKHVPLDFQLELIRRGHHLLPFIPFPVPELRGEGGKPGKAQPADAAYEQALKQLAAWDLPFALVGTQWEATLTDHLNKWRGLPPGQSPLVWSVPANPDKPTAKMLSPFGAVEPWREVGRHWTDSPPMKRLQELYPNPPRVLMISNNEASRLRWHDVDADKHYVDKYGPDKDDDFKRKVVGDGWVERYKAMFDGMRQGLSADAWRRNARFLGYNSFGPANFGQTDNWKRWSTATDDRVSHNWFVWDGGIPSSYDNHWQTEKHAFSLWSMQTEAMNWAMMKEDALRANPEYFLEVVLWDGHPKANPKKPAAEGAGPKDKYLQYEKLGVKYTPEVYRGWVQYVMWTLRPRVAREWRSFGDGPRDDWWPHFSQVVRAVDVVHADPVLAKFWRQGALVPNRAHDHPYDKDVPDKWKKADRWFALDTSADPPRPWELTARIPVYALARVIGSAPKREWLIYAHAPAGEMKQVRVTLPEFRPVTIDVTVGGNFHHVTEAEGVPNAVGALSQVPEAPAHVDRP
jgi:hypothetical protein